MFNKTFYRFFFVFVVIIAVAFGVLIFAGTRTSTSPADNVAQPQNS